MARLLALEWDAREARVALGRTRGKEIIAEQAFAVELGPSDPGETFADPNVGERVAAALAARGIGAVDTLVAVGRASIELRLLQLPPAPEEELPDLVRFQALRQFANIGDDWPLDYIKLSASDEPLNVLAAAISPDLVTQIDQTCQAGNLSPRRLVLRPFAAASLLRRFAHDTVDGCCLVVDLLADEADLTVLADGQVVFMRTVRLPVLERADAQSRALLGEIRRTTGAAQNQLGGRRVERAVVCGNDEEHVELRTAIERQLSLEVVSFDPFQHLTLGGELRDRQPDRPGRYAPLLGLLSDEAAGAAHAIDFLHPRQRPKPPDRRRSVVLLASLAASLLAAVSFLGWSKVRAKDRKIVQLRAQSVALDDAVEDAQSTVADTLELDKFADGDVTWLDELRELAGDLPPADDAILTQVILGERSPRGGQIIVEGFVRDPSMIDKMERDLTDERHLVNGDRGQKEAGRETYIWRFKERIFVEPADREAATPKEGEPPKPDREAATPKEGEPPKPDAKPQANSSEGASS